VATKVIFKAPEEVVMKEKELEVSYQWRIALQYLFHILGSY